MVQGGIGGGGGFSVARACALPTVQARARYIGRGVGIDGLGILPDLHGTQNKRVTCGH